MNGELNQTTRKESYGPIDVDRRTLTKLIGMTGVTVIGAGTVSGSETVNSGEATVLMNIKPTFNNVLVQRTDAEENTGSGILLPRNTDLESGIARAIGDEATQVGEGDSLLYEGSGSEITIAGEKHVLISEEQIQSIVEA